MSDVVAVECTERRNDQTLMPTLPSVPPSKARFPAGKKASLPVESAVSETGGTVQVSIERYLTLPHLQSIRCVFEAKGLGGLLPSPGLEEVRSVDFTVLSTTHGYLRPNKQLSSVTSKTILQSGS